MPALLTRTAGGAARSASTRVEAGAVGDVGLQ